MGFIMVCGHSKGTVHNNSTGNIFFFFLWTSLAIVLQSTADHKEMKC